MAWAFCTPIQRTGGAKIRPATAISKGFDHLCSPKMAEVELKHASQGKFPFISALSRACAVCNHSRVATISAAPTRHGSLVAVATRPRWAGICGYLRMARRFFLPAKILVVWQAITFATR